MIDTNSEYQWHGSSQALNQLERRLNKFSGVNFPVLIRGDKGTGKQVAAYRIHQMGIRKHADFVSDCCLQWRESDVSELFNSAYKRATGGTLFLKNINSLSRPSILKIQHYWEREYMGKSIPTRIICTLSPFYENEHIIESSAPWLSLELPSLNERKEDIPVIINALIIKYKNVQSIEISEECWPYIIANNWSDNVKGLERFIAKLVVLSEVSVIQKNTLFELFPVFQKIDIPKTNSFQQPKFLGNAPGLGMKKTNGLAQALLEQKIPNESAQHLAISRSLDFIKNQFNEKISIDNVAKKHALARRIYPFFLESIWEYHLSSCCCNCELNIQRSYYVTTLKCK